MGCLDLFRKTSAAIRARIETMPHITPVDETGDIRSMATGAHHGSASQVRVGVVLVLV